MKIGLNVEVRVAELGVGMLTLFYYRVDLSAALLSGSFVAWGSIEGLEVTGFVN